MAPGHLKCPHPTPWPTKSNSPLPKEVGSWGCNKCSTYSWKGRSTAGKGMMRTGRGCLQDAGKQAGLQGAAAHLSGRSRYWQCSAEPRCPQTRPVAFLGSRGPGTSEEMGKRLKGRAQHGGEVARRGASTHRVVCEPLQDDGSGEGVAARAESRPSLAPARPPAPARPR